MPISRRDFLRAAGGVTFLALTPVGPGLFAASRPPGVAALPVPLFTVVPYIQPGPAGALAENQDTLVVAWQTEDALADFAVDFGVTKGYGRAAEVIRGERVIGSSERPPATPEEAQRDNDQAVVDRRLNYHATLTGLPLASVIRYRVRCNGQTIAEGYASTRKRRGSKIRFATFGDNSFGDISDRAIAYLAYQAHPDFVMNTGDNVYDAGLDNEYARYFFPSYNADQAAPHDGAPLLRSVPFYTVMANHDVASKMPDGRSGADFDANNDALAYYTAMHLPLNGPASPPDPTPTHCSEDAVMQQFRECAGERFPRMANYSHDHGDAHFLCLDSNTYIDPTNADLQRYIEADLSGTDAVWKFVVYHHPAFNVGEEHYREQHMRVLSPLFEKHGVDIIFNGHEHTYQRTKPLKFSPTDITKAADVTSHDRRIPGVFTLDEAFDGRRVTRPNGIIHITTGAGGRALYEPDFTDNPQRWLHPDDNNVAYVVRFYSAHHSLTIVDIDGPSLYLRQINEFGDEIDSIHMTKA